MPSLTWEESLQLDRERVRFVDQIMSKLGFRHHKEAESYSGPYKFTEVILYLHTESGDGVAVSFPREDQAEHGFDITAQAEFNNKITSPEWKSLHQFEAKIGFWIEDCRRQERPHE
ncbi:MAG: hypothetical protein HY913_04325 [Desulfomonile tiedjei]|nr:hypothetical protein [Desulfomonile tiedjei]